MANQEYNALFDWGLYGCLIRKARVDLGYTKADDFADSIYRRTHVRINRDLLYRIESGKQIPDAMQFMAINLSLSGTLFYEKILELCLSRDVKDICETYKNNPEYSPEFPYIPEEWKIENTIDYMEKHEIDPDEQIRILEDRPSLFQPLPL